jgi:hypothetical protein
MDLFSFVTSIIFEQVNAKKPGSAALGGTTLAAVLPEIVGQAAEGLEVGGVVVERAFAPRLEESGIHEALEVVTQCGGGHIHVMLNVPRRRTVRPALHDEAQDREADRMPECGQLLGSLLQFGGHALLLIFSK